MFIRETSCNIFADNIFHIFSHENYKGTNENGDLTKLSVLM